MLPFCLHIGGIILYESHTGDECIVIKEKSHNVLVHCAVAIQSDLSTTNVVFVEKLEEAESMK